MRNLVLIFFEKKNKKISKIVENFTNIINLNIIVLTFSKNVHIF